MSTVVPLHRSPVIAAALLLLQAASAFLPAARAAERVSQLAEPSARTRPIETPSTAFAPPLTEICEPGATWLRLGFRSLKLGGYDSLTLTSSGGDTFTFEGTQWKAGTRSARARCVATACRSSRGSPIARAAMSSTAYQFGTQPLENTTVVVAGAGDICDGTDCSRTAALITAINPVSVFTAGDNAYGSGTLAEYNSYYKHVLGTVPQHRHRRRRAITNTARAARRVTSTISTASGVATGIAGERGKGYYSWDVGDWHFIALNSNIAMTVRFAAGNVAAQQSRREYEALHRGRAGITRIISRGNYTGVPAVAAALECAL